MTKNDFSASDMEASILYIVPDPLIWVKPVFAEGNAIEDFEVCYANKAAIDGIGHPLGDLKGLYIRRDGVPSKQNGEANFKHFLEVYESGQLREYTFSAPYTNRVYETMRHPHMGGVVSITRDRGAQREAEKREEAVRRTMQSIVKSSPIGIALFESIRDSNGSIIDFRPRVYNEQRSNLLGLTDDEAANLPLRDVLKILKSEDSFAKYVSVVEDDTMIQREQYVERSGKWLSISTVRLDDGFLAMLSDVTELKESQEVLQKQSAYLDSILNASLNSVCTCEAVRDGNGEIVDLKYMQINEMYTKMVGIEKDQVLGKTMRELFPTAVDNGVFETHCNVIRTGISKRFDLKYKGEGLDAWFDISSVKVGDNGVVITFADVMEQKTASEKIQEQKKLLDKLLSSSSNGISVTEMIRDKSGKVVDCRTILANDAAVEIAGIPREIYLTQPATEVEPSIIESPYFQMCISTLETGEPFITQYFLEWSGRWLELSVSRMDQDHLIHIFTDVTPIKESQLQKDRLVDELRRSNKSLEEFAHAASHDMKEPIRKIMTFANRLKDKVEDKLDEQDMTFINRIETAAQRMHMLVDDLLEFSHVSERPQEMESIDLNEKVKTVLADLDLPIEEKGAKVTVGELPVIKGNKRQLQQLLLNTIGNALKYSKPGVRPEISISSKTVSGASLSNHGIPSSRASEQFHVIDISDNGIGFEQQYSEQIFRMFQRLHGKNEYSGSGVGLSIAKKVIENHNGYMWATGELGKGSVFTIALPVK